MYNRENRYYSHTLMWVIILLNVLVYVATLLNKNFIYTYMGFTPVLLAEQPWTIITNMFVHAGLWHLIANMLTFYYFTTYMARLVGMSRVMLVYFIGGIIGNVFFFFLGYPYAIAVGASGGVFALGGAMAIMRPNLRVYIIPFPFAVPLWGAIFGGFVLVSFIGSVAWQAHLGGLIIGVIAGLIFRKWERRQIYRW